MSGSESHDSISATTSEATFTPHIETERDSNGHVSFVHFDAISARIDCRDSSLEELRMSDYKKGRALVRKKVHLTSGPAPSGVWTNQRNKEKGQLDLLRGAGIEVSVGVAKDPRNIWCLPKTLLSYHSPFIRDVFQSQTKERSQDPINLPDCTSSAFALFVEWMYYSAYTVSGWEFGSINNITLDAKCWVLGDRLRCIAFKNYAMSRLYNQLTALFGATPLAVSSIQYAFDNSKKGSKLRLLYAAFVVTHFSDRDRLKGTAEEWDEVLLGNADLRLMLVENLRKPHKERIIIEKQQVYLEQDSDLPDVFSDLAIVCTPSKA